MSDKSTLPSNLAVRAVIALDGVYYVTLACEGHIWRLGSTNPDWQQAMNSPNPASHGVFVHDSFNDSQQYKKARLAVMCCGLGSVWPGMGRELYENFAIARQAMEEAATLADWNVLDLLAEESLEKVSQTRLQIPYLFLLEYSQWRLFHTLGLRPALISGHSLGELVALCVAGVYDLPTAWYLLDTRAEHMAELESANDHQGGMLAVPAPFEQILPVLEQWPNLRVANRNTLHQYILGGPRCELREARKQLRRAKIPAILLNIDLAFHNPAMRILRDISLARLNSLPMTPGEFPVLSCVDAELYPKMQPDICRRIADLDENTVDWVGSVQTMCAKHGITHFLELGPQETLCGLVTEINPDASCLAADSKGHEAQTMRSTLATLFSLGFLDFSCLAAQAETTIRPPELFFPEKTSPGEFPAGVSDAECEIIINLLAEASHKAPKDITADLDLRRDLGLRSSTFPFLVLQAEEKLGRTIALETLVPLTTVADAVSFLTGLPPSQTQKRASTTAHFQIARRPLLRFRQQDGKWLPGLLEPTVCHTDQIVIACVHSHCLMQGIADAAGKVVKVKPYGCQPAQIEQFATELQATARLSPNGIVLELPSDCAPYAENLVEVCVRFLDTLPKHGWLIIINAVHADNAEIWLKTIRTQLNSHDLTWRAIAWLKERDNEFLAQEVADMLAREIWYGSEREILWQKKTKSTANIYCRASRYFNFIYPSCTPAKESGVFEGNCQFSRFNDDELASHGANALFTPLRQNNPISPFQSSPWLPLCRILTAMCAGAALVAGVSHFIGLADVRIYRLPGLPDGITRLCRLASSSRMRFPLYGIPARLCRVIMDVAELTATGRQNGRWLPLAQCSFMAAKAYPPLETMWPPFAADKAAPLSSVDLANFYKAVGFAPVWHYIQKFTGVPGYMGVATLTLHSTEPWSFELLLEGALQTALLLNSMPSESAAQMAENMTHWRFSTIGLARFAEHMPAGEAFLHIRLSWHDNRLRRYDGQIFDSHNNMLLAFHNLEFDCVLPKGDN